VPSPNPNPDDSNLEDVQVISDTSAWAVGFYRNGNVQPLAMHWNGSVWALAPSPQPDAYMTFNAVGIVGRNIWTAGGRDDLEGTQRTFAFHCCQR
jgi:hypothetical protein